MPELAPPRTHTARMAFLDSASTRESALNLLQPWLAEKLYAARCRFVALYEREGELAAQLAEVYAEKEQALSRLNMFIRHYWQAIRVQVRRGELPVETFLHLGLNRAGRNLRLVRISEKLNAARLVVAGAELMASQGWSLPQQPAACEVEAIAEQVKMLTSQCGQVEGQYTRLRNEMAEMAAEIGVIYGQVYRSVKLVLHDRPDAEKRLILRHYGYLFRYRRGRDQITRNTRQQPSAPGPAQTTRAPGPNKPVPAEEVQSRWDREALGQHRQPETANVQTPKQKSPTREERLRSATIERQTLRRLARKDRYRRAKSRRRREAFLQDLPKHPPQATEALESTHHLCFQGRCDTTTNEAGPRRSHQRWGHGEQPT